MFFAVYERQSSDSAASYGGLSRVESDVGIPSSSSRIVRLRLERRTIGCVLARLWRPDEEVSCGLVAAHTMGIASSASEAAHGKSHGWCACSASRRSLQVHLEPLFFDLRALLNGNGLCVSHPRHLTQCHPHRAPRHPLRDSRSRTHTTRAPRSSSPSASSPRRPRSCPSRRSRAPSAASSSRARRASRRPGNSIAITLHVAPGAPRRHARGRRGLRPARLRGQPAEPAFYAPRPRSSTRASRCCARRAGRSRSSCTRASPSRSARSRCSRRAAARPSVLNGGFFDKPNGLIGLAALIERGVGDRDAHGHEQARRLGRDGRQDRHAGEFNFDPIGLYGKTDAEKACARRRSRTAASR